MLQLCETAEDLGIRIKHPGFDVGVERNLLEEGKRQNGVLQSRGLGHSVVSKRWDACKTWGGETLQGQNLRRQSRAAQRPAAGGVKRRGLNL